MKKKELLQEMLTEFRRDYGEPNSALRKDIKDGLLASIRELDNKTKREIAELRDKIVAMNNGEFGKLRDEINAIPNQIRSMTNTQIDEVSRLFSDSKLNIETLNNAINALDEHCSHIQSKIDKQLAFLSDAFRDAITVHSKQYIDQALSDQNSVLMRIVVESIHKTVNAVTVRFWKALLDKKRMLVVTKEQYEKVMPQLINSAIMPMGTEGEVETTVRDLSNNK